jgi:hypothetical protein
MGKITLKTIGINNKSYNLDQGSSSVVDCIVAYDDTMKRGVICIYVSTAAQAHIPFTRAVFWSDQIPCLLSKKQKKSHAHIPFTGQNSLTRDTPNGTSNFTAAKRAVGRLKV